MLPKLSDTEAKNIIQQSPPAKRRRSSILADSQKLQVRIRAVELCEHMGLDWKNRYVQINPSATQGNLESHCTKVIGKDRNGSTLLG